MLYAKQISTDLDITSRKSNDVRHQHFAHKTSIYREIGKKALYAITTWAIKLPLQ